jgi:hypothetical protein
VGTSHHCTLQVRIESRNTTNYPSVSCPETEDLEIKIFNHPRFKESLKSRKAGDTEIIIMTRGSL